MKFSIVILFIFSVLVLTAAEPLPKWGDISMEDLSMKVYPADSNAAAVILSDNGIYSLQFDVFRHPIIYERQVRIKILKSSGFNAGEILIPYIEKYNIERVIDIKAHTIYLDENNKKVETQIDKKFIFDQKLNGDMHATKFAFPDIKEGCVLEYYIKTYQARLSVVGTWYFQNEYPTRESRITTRFPDFYFFKMYLKGNISLTSTTSEDYNESGYDGTIKTYSILNVPAFKKENYCPNYLDYYPQINFYLIETRFPRQVKFTLVSDWDKMARTIKENEYIGLRIKTSPFFVSLAKEITNGKFTTEEKTEAIYNYVRNNILWNKYRTIFAYDDLKTVLEERNGSSAEINLVLLSLLRCLDIDSRMVFISTIDNGQAQSELPVGEQFNNILVSVHAGDNFMILDATDPNRGIDMLDKFDLNISGFEIRPDKSDWIYLQVPKASRTLSVVNLVLNESGDLKGSIDYSSDGYTGLDLMDKYVQGEEKKFVDESFYQSKVKIKFENVQVSPIDTMNKSFKFKSTASFSGNKDNNRIYFSPLINVGMQSNPFESSVRNFPVNFIYPIKETNIFNVTIPEGFKLVESLNSTKILLPDSTLSFSLISVSDGKTIQVKTILERQRTIYEVDEYGTLSDFYSKVSKLINSQIILEKI